MLDQIVELVRHLDNVHSASQFAKLTQSLGEKQGKILDKVRDGETDDIAIYGAIYGSVKDMRPAYEKAKQRLYYELVQSFFMPKQARVSNGYDFYRNKSIEYTALAKIMSATPCQLNLIHLVREGLKFSKKADMTENVMELLKIQMNIYGSVKQDSYKFNKALEQYRHYEQLNRTESDTQIQYWKIYSLSKINKKDLRLEDGYVNQLRQNIKSQVSFKMTMYSFQTLSILYERNHQYNELLDMSNRALAYVDTRPFNSSRLRAFFMRRKYICCLKLKRYEELAIVFEEYFSELPKYSANWYLLKCYDTILLIHDEKYLAAVDNMPNVLKYSKGVPENIIEFYRLVRGYTKVLHNVAVDLNHSDGSKFRIFKLLNQLPIHSQEKAGLNIAILNLQIVHAIDNRKYDDLIDRVDALKQYQHRHLKKKKSFRSFCFVKMIIEMTKADFHPMRTERYTKEILEKLKSVPLELSEQPLEVEIVPYEHLWEIIMKLLERNSQVKRNRSSES